MDATVPVPSTWPCSTCPPRRSLGRSGSSTFTWSPGRSAPSEVRRSVSGITSASKAPSPTAVAVRQTPFTATESPSASSRPASSLSLPSSSEATRAVPWISPVNTSPLPEPRGDQHVVVDALHLRGERARRAGNRPGAEPLDGGARLAPTRHERGHEHAQLVDLAGFEERAGQVRAPLE